MVRAERHRIGVASDAVSRFENSYIVSLRQKPGRRQTGNSRSDDGDAAALFFFRFGVDHFSSLSHWQSSPGDRDMYEEAARSVSPAHRFFEILSGA
ncbi:hypothetical protein [Agrobacterium sp. YIC 4121]|uniref:hypothetical protein n=1 Tax=Agrobacterium sp. YIC 4121 TaxID=1923829 RepID=UPI001FD8D82F|nr:hypothetical protein [Agrobacterium sp. YIC 4121]